MHRALFMVDPMLLWLTDGRAIFHEPVHNRSRPLAGVNTGLWHIVSKEEEVKSSLCLLIVSWSLSHEQMGLGYLDGGSIRQAITLADGFFLELNVINTKPANLF